MLNVAHNELQAPQQWLAAQRKHEHLADTLSAGRRHRAMRGIKEPVSDFLWEYYGVKPRHLRRWEPGVGVRLARPRQSGAELDAWREIAGRRWFVSDEDATWLDADAWRTDRGRGASFIRSVIEAVEMREPRLGCLGLHEWAMVYEGEPRHPLPLRLGREGSDEVTRSLPIRCTHFDAFRFFTPNARPLNEFQPNADTVVAMEQPGCLHQNMDSLRYCLKLGPIVPGSLLLESFQFALEVRKLDMAASPYLCEGLDPVRIETQEGRAQYIERQRAFMERGHRLRLRLLNVLDKAGVRPRASEQA